MSTGNPSTCQRLFGRGGFSPAWARKRSEGKRAGEKKEAEEDEDEEEESSRHALHAYLMLGLEMSAAQFPHCASQFLRKALVAALIKHWCQSK